MSTENPTPPVKLQLILQDFDGDQWRSHLTRSERLGIRFYSLAELGDNEANRRRLYGLNKECSADIPGRGPFYSYEEYCKQRLEAESFLPDGVVLAVEGDAWVGMAGVSYRAGRDYAFNEMTGVVRAYRRQGIATSLKILAIQFAKSLGVPYLYTVHAAANLTAIAMNRRLGYIDRP